MDIKALAAKYEPYIIERRHYYHAHPELTNEEVETRASIRRDLEAMGVTDIREMEHCYGLVATIHGGRPGRTVALRTDTDALKVQEETGLPYASQCPGKMHACGHDCHMAMLLGAARILNEVKAELCGDVRLIVQPAEELVLGSKAMIAEGALDGVDAIYGNHVWGALDAPYVDVTYGPRMAYAGVAYIDIDGMSAHGSAPHLGHDAITAAAAVIENIQQYVSRMNDPLNPVVMTIGVIEGGDRFNVIPKHVHLEATLRAYTSERHEEVLRSIIEHTAAAFDCTGKLSYEHVVAPMNNDDEELVNIAANAVTKLFGQESLKHLDKMLGSEDFANYALKVPSVFTFLGSRDESIGAVYSNHSEKYAPSDDILQRGSAVMAQFAADYLAAHAE